MAGDERGRLGAAGRQRRVGGGGGAPDMTTSALPSWRVETGDTVERIAAATHARLGGAFSQAQYAAALARALVGAGRIPRSAALHRLVGQDLLLPTTTELDAARTQLAREGKLDAVRKKGSVSQRIEAAQRQLAGKRAPTACEQGLAAPAVAETTSADGTAHHRETATRSDDASAALRALADVPGVTARAVEEVSTFIDDHYRELEPEARAALLATLVRLGAHERFAESEKVEAMKAYLVVHDAVSHGKVTASLAQRLADAFLPALERGAVGVRLVALPRSHAAYDTTRNDLLVADRNHLALPTPAGDGSFVSFDRFFVELAGGADERFLALRGILSTQTQALLAAWGRARTVPAAGTIDPEYLATLKALAKDLDALLERATLASELEPALRAVRGRFGDERDAELLRLMNPRHEPRAAGLVRKNRLLLERLLPDHLVAAPQSGIDLDTERGRAFVIHEALHVTQDAAREIGRPIDFEYRGHRAFADYLLHAHGALRETAAGARTDWEAFLRLTESGPAGEAPLLSGIDGIAAQELFFEARAAELRRELDGGRLTDEHTERLIACSSNVALPAGYDPLDARTHELLRLAALAAFGRAYVEAQEHSRDPGGRLEPGKRDAIGAYYRMPYRKDGL